MISGMNHFTVVAEDPKATTDYYIGLLGLKDGYRPDLGFPGAWLYCGDAWVLQPRCSKRCPISLPLPIRPANGVTSARCRFGVPMI